MAVYDLIVIGGGPSGITAGIYAARQKLNTLLITKDFGGQIARKTVGIENYPGLEDISGFDLIKKFEKQLRKHKIDIERDEAKSIKKISKGFLVLTKSRHRFQSRAVIIASGADPRPLEVPGEKKFIGRGISYCVICDAPLFADKTVAVIGGGNSAFEAAIFLADWAKKVYILEYGEAVRADMENQERAKKIEKIEIMVNAQSKEVKGKQFVNSLVYLDKKTGKKNNLAVEGIFVEIGYQPATSFVKDLVDFNEKDEIIVNHKTGGTKTPGLFAAGDVNDGPCKQVVIAAGEGAKAALEAANYLRKLNF